MGVLVGVLFEQHTFPTSCSTGSGARCMPTSDIESSLASGKEISNGSSTPLRQPFCAPTRHFAGKIGGFAHFLLWGAGLPFGGGIVIASRVGTRLHELSLPLRVVCSLASPDYRRHWSCCALSFHLRWRRFARPTLRPAWRGLGGRVSGPLSRATGLPRCSRPATLVPTVVGTQFAPSLRSVASLARRATVAVAPLCGATAFLPRPFLPSRRPRLALLSRAAGRLPKVG